VLVALQVAGTAHSLGSAGSGDGRELVGTAGGLDILLHIGMKNRPAGSKVVGTGGNPAALSHMPNAPDAPQQETAARVIAESGRSYVAVAEVVEDNIHTLLGYCGSTT
jgi:hypothetical protein